MDNKYFKKQLDSILKEYELCKVKPHFNDFQYASDVDQQSLVTKAIATIHRISGINSSYSKDVDLIIKLDPYLHQHTTNIIGVVQALRDDLAKGYLRSLEEIVHSDIFSDFLEMAQYLCDSGYKDAAAVIAGSTLESHLRSLCHKAEIPVTVEKDNGVIVPKKADGINNELAKAEIYTKLEQKSVTAWLDLRNKAAHGKYTEYDEKQVASLINDVRNFIVRNPA